jgi:amino acid adenylation domain-containing protein
VTELKHSVTPVSAAESVASAPQGDAYVFPMSYSQQQLWVVDQLQGGNAAYNVALDIRLEGSLDDSALQGALDELVRRHESLRTVFRLEGGQPSQVVMPAGPLIIARSDLRNLPPEAREAERKNIACDEARQPFQLAAGPLFRARLMDCGENDHTLVLIFHHIVFDRASIDVFIRDFTALYSSLRKGVSPELPALPIQYADYSVWQRQTLRGPVVDAQLEYWKRQLEGAPESFELPLDRPRGNERSLRGEWMAESFPRELLDSLEALAQEEGTTLFAALLASFDTILYRYTGQEDVVIGSTSPGRGQKATQDLIGTFINPLVLRVDLSGDPSFRELLGRARKTVEEAGEHQDVPFERIVEELRLEHDPSRNPLFQVMLLFQELAEGAREADGLKLTWTGVQNHTAKFDLSAYIEPREEGLFVGFEYNADVFEPPTIQRLLGHYRTLLEAIVAAPDTRISEITILADAERNQLLFELNGTAVDFPEKDSALHELIERQVERAPDRVAVEFEGQTLTYRQLNSRANQLAHFLRKQGAGPGVLVGVSMERSLEMVVALLGALKAGAAYVPLDPTYPEDRLAFMVEDSGLKVLLTQQSLLPLWSGSHAQLVLLDRDWSAIAGEPVENPAVAVRPDDLAYVIYTSGSTGRPKGVQIPHRAVVNFVLSMQSKPGISAADNLLAVTTISFDIAGLEIHVPLASGARIVLASRQAAMDGKILARLLEVHGITVMQATPVTWRLLLESGWKGKSDLKVLCGGEAFPRDLADALLTRSASAWNMYGPTETTIWSTCDRVRPSKGPVLIGQPIANTQTYILDSSLQVVPMGVVGELYIGGDGLARGYWNRPELTAERFVSHPFLLGDRLYRTGDLARVLTTGQIECLGRVDHQVKIRGFRIELGEIETAIADFPEIRQAVVVAREDAPGDKRLAAYVVAAQPEKFRAAELREWLKQRLPPYMIPAAVVALPALPLTNNGKIDRKALPSPEQASAAATGQFAAPRTQTEKDMAAIWQQVLGVEKVGIHDNFFDLGGHSLLAVNLFAQITQTFGNTLSLNTLFETPTVEDLARFIDDHRESTPKNRVIPIRPQGTKPPVYWIPGGVGSVLAFRKISDLLGASQPVYGLESRVPEPGETIESVEVRAKHLLGQIRAFQPKGPYYFIGFCAGGLVAYEMAQQLRIMGERTAFLALVESVPYNYSGFRIRVASYYVQHYWWKLRQNLINGGVVATLKTAYGWATRRGDSESGDEVAPPNPALIADSSPEAMANIRRIELALRQTDKEYIPEPYPGSACLIVGEGDYWCQGVTTDTDLRLAWTRLAGGGTKIDILPGDHLDMLFEPLVRNFGEKLANRLREAQVANWKGASETAGRGSSRAAQVTAVPPATSAGANLVTPLEGTTSAESFPAIRAKVGNPISSQ